MRGDPSAEAQPYKGMSQTKVKSRMYASKFPTERSPVAKCVMIAEANTDAPKFRFYTLYGRVMDMETLRCAWRCVRKLKKASGVDGAFYSVGYPSRVFRKVNHYVLKCMARFLNRKSQRYYRLKFADTYYGEMTHYGLYRLAWADVRRAR